MKNFFKKTLQLLKESGNRWMAHDPWTLSAAISYYSIISIPGLLVIIIYIAGELYGPQAIRGEIFDQIDDFVGEESAAAIQKMVKNTQIGDKGIWATIVGVFSIVLSGTAVFLQLQRALNQIWGVKIDPKKASNFKIVWDRLWTFVMIVGIGLLIIASVILSSLISFLSDWFSENLFEYAAYLFRLISILISLGLATVLFTAIYRVLPDVKSRWRDLWLGGFVTALLFTIGKSLIGFYLGQSNAGSAYGAAGSAILVLLWVAYSSLIFLFGAAFTQVYANKYGGRIRPASYAVEIPKIEQLEKEKQN